MQRQVSYRPQAGCRQCERGCLCPPGGSDAYANISSSPCLLPPRLVLDILRILKTEELLPTPPPSFFPLNEGVHHHHPNKPTGEAHLLFLKNGAAGCCFPFLSPLLQTCPLPQFLPVSYPGIFIISDYIFHVSSGSIFYFHMNRQENGTGFDKCQ